MKQLNIGIVLTGELRYLDWTIPYWKDFCNNSAHNITIISSTWCHLDRARSTEKTDISDSLDSLTENNIEHVLTQLGIPCVIAHDNFNEYKLKTPGTIKSIVDNYRSWEYVFGRTLQYSKAVDAYADKFDYMFHARWDALIDNFNSEFDWLVSDHVDNNTVWIARGLSVVLGDFYVDDTVYGTSIDKIKKCYSNTDQVFKDTIDVFLDIEHYFGLGFLSNPNVIPGHLVGHSQFLRHLMFHRQTISDYTSRLIYTFFRNHTVPYAYNKETYLDIAINPLPSEYTQEILECQKQK